MKNTYYIVLKFVLIFIGIVHISTLATNAQEKKYGTFYSFEDLSSDIPLLSLYFVFTPKKLNAFFAIVPSLVPFYFLIMYMIGLYWYGHNLGLHGGGAFEGINDFMPTVFGEGKVAQFTTVSYPYFGFLVAFLAFVSLTLAMLLKRKDLKEEQTSEPA